MARFTQTAWADRMMRATPEARRTMVQELARGDHEITGDDGKAIDLSPPPTHVDVAPLPPFAVRDSYGRVIAEAAPPLEPVPKRISRGFTLENRQSFEQEILHEPEATRASLRLQYDALRKQHGID